MVDSSIAFSFSAILVVHWLFCGRTVRFGRMEAKQTDACAHQREAARVAIAWLTKHVLPDKCDQSKNGFPTSERFSET